MTNPQKTFDFLVFIGRFQPFHKGHLYVIHKALSQAERVIVLIGSSYQARTIRNPWTFSEREQHVRANFSAAEQERLITLPLMDDMYNDQNWVMRVQQSVSGVVCRFPPRLDGKTPAIGLIGHNKDETSFYLSLFPQWHSMEVEAYESLSSTPMRKRYFLQGEIAAAFPEAVRTALTAFKQQAAYHYVAEEWRFIEQYKQAWASAPYPPTFVTVDAVVVQAGHVLMVERKTRPGQGQLALPGGFLDGKERLRDAMIRELREETRLRVPAAVLKGSITRQHVFDHPNRSMRGRTLTHAYLIELKPDAGGLPKVKGGDDARHAFWIPLGELNPEQLFEDHFHVIKYLLG